LLRRHGGYVLEADPETIDLHRFRSRLAAARASSDDVRGSVRLFREALGCWKGQALGGLSGDWAARVRKLLELEKLFALVECHEGELRLGCHAALLDELHVLADQHPDNELVIRNLMTALYRSGRQAEALGRFEDLRRRLADHLGVDPAQQTQELHTRMLRADPALEIRPRPPRPFRRCRTSCRAAPASSGVSRSWRPWTASWPPR
jgi:DNA-binding SARP family transcriptional activator